MKNTSSSVNVRAELLQSASCVLMFPLGLRLQEGAGVGFQRRHHPPSVLQAKEWRAQPLPILPQNRDVPADVGPALPGDAHHTGSRHRRRRVGGVFSVLSSPLIFSFVPVVFFFLLSLTPLACGVDGCQSNNVNKQDLIPRYTPRRLNDLKSK